MHEFKGWVTIKDHVIKIRWKPKESLSISSSYKALCESVSGEAALMKGQTEVIISPPSCFPYHGLTQFKHITDFVFIVHRLTEFSGTKSIVFLQNVTLTSTTMTPI
jgi:hypothetical protein